MTEMTIEVESRHGKQSITLDAMPCTGDGPTRCGECAGCVALKKAILLAMRLNIGAENTQ